MLNVCLDCNFHSFYWIFYVHHSDSLEYRDKKTGQDANIHQVLKCVSLTLHVKSCAILIPSLQTRQCCVSAIEGMKLTGCNLPWWQSKAALKMRPVPSCKHILSSECFHYRAVIYYLLWATHGFRSIDSTLRTILTGFWKAHISARERLR